MSPDLLDFSAGEGLRRAVLLKNALLADRIQQQLQLQLQLQQQQQQQQQQAALMAAQAAHNDDGFIPLAYPWQQQLQAPAPAPVALSSPRSQLSLPSPYFVGHGGDDLTSSSSSSSSASASPSASPSSSVSSLEASIIEEREQAWFDDVLSELEAGDFPPAPPAAHCLDNADEDTDEADNEQLLASLTASLQLSRDGHSHHPAPGIDISESVPSLRSSSTSFELGASLDDVPDLVHDDGMDSSDDEHLGDDDDDDDEQDAAPATPPSSSTLISSSSPAPHQQQIKQPLPPVSPLVALASPPSVPVPVPVSVSISNPNPLSQPAFLDRHRSLLLPTSASPPSSQTLSSQQAPLTAQALDKLFQQQHQQHQHEDSAILHLLPPVFAFPAASPLRPRSMRVP
ncbi:hypothetical protein OC835_000368 [Tilletia horrida]|nr:hypothetical protein OC835_000368 [Tilletia horrida]